jgi:hypothetical protein
METPTQISVCCAVFRF